MGTTGDVRLCCNSLNGTILNGNQQLRVGGQKSLDFFTDSSHLNRIRKSMLVGERPEECKRCWDMEKTGQTSFRELANSEFVNTYQRLKSGDTSVSLEYLNFDLGNKCNIACRMCTPVSSSLLAKEVAAGEGQLSPHEVNLAKGVLEKTKSFFWFEDLDFWELLKPRLHEVKRVYLIGGEPFIIPEHLKLLDLLIEHGVPSETVISYNSNLSVFPERIFERWRKFKSVKVNASIDGTNQIYEYIRWPMKFDRIKGNLKQLIDENLPNVHLSVHSTIQNLNVLNLTDLLDFFYGMDILFIPVHHPSYLSISVMPLPELKTALNQLLRYKDKLDPKVPGYFSRSVENAIHFVADAVKNYKEEPFLREQFIRTMKFHDARRNQNLEITHPHFSPWCKDFSKQEVNQL